MIQTEIFKNFIIYSDDNDKIHVNVMLINNDLWLTQKSMAELFDVAENNITYHLQNIFKTNELQKESVTQKIRVTANDGKSYKSN